MPRAAKSAGPSQSSAAAIDSVLMTFEQRRMKHGFVFGAKGTCVEIDFAEPPRLNTDDVLVLEDGSLVEVVAEAEPLLEARIPDAVALGRACWLLGNKHVPTQILSNRIRVQRSDLNAALLVQFVSKIAAIEAPFEPDREPEAHSHDHGHDHGHTHVHDAHCGHDHGTHSHHKNHAAHDHAHHEHGHDAHHRK